MFLLRAATVAVDVACALAVAFDVDPVDGDTSLAPKSGSVGNSLRSDSRRFFIRFRHQRRVAIDGVHVKYNDNGNFTSKCKCKCKCKCYGNCNWRYAERQGQRQLSL